MNYRELIFDDKYLSEEYIKDSLRDVLEDYPITLEINYFCLNPISAKLFCIKDKDLGVITDMATSIIDESFLVRYSEITLSYPISNLAFDTLAEYKEQIIKELKLIEDIEFCLVRIPNYKVDKTIKNADVSKVIIRSDIQTVDKSIIKKLVVYKEDRLKKSKEELEVARQRAFDSIMDDMDIFDGFDMYNDPTITELDSF